MFDTTEEKGLFTFYWEQSNSTSLLHSKVQSLPGKEVDQIVRENKKKEEKIQKQQVSSKVFAPKEEVLKSRKYVLNEVVSNRSRQKGSQRSGEERYLAVWDMDLQKTFHEFNLKNEVRHKQKQNTTRLNLKKSIELPKLRKLTSPNQMQNAQEHQIINKLLKQEEKASPLTLQISSQTQHPSPRYKVDRSTKVKKTIKNKSKNQQILGKNTDRLSQVQSSVILSKNRSMHKFPMLPKSTKKHKKLQPLYLQKLMLDRKEMPRAGSVVNMSISGADEYKDRFVRRKEQFLRLIQRNINQSLID